MSKLSRSKALEYISNWSTTNVIEILKKNGLGECCPAVLKRQIDGDELLHLTEGKLALWKSDLSRSQTWSLWTFVEGLNREPEEHVLANTADVIQNDQQEAISDSASWGTDFEDDEDDDDSPTLIRKNIVLRKNNVPEQSTGFRNSLMVFQNREKLAQDQKQFTNINNNNNSNTNNNKSNDNTNNNNGRPESIYMNCDDANSVEPAEEENAYMNLEYEGIHKKLEKTLTVQLKNRSTENLCTPSAKTTINKLEVPIEKPPRPSKPAPRLYNPPARTTNNVDNNEIRKPAVSPCRDRSPAIPERPDELPKPPIMIRNFDLVANLPTRTDESDDEYEAFDEEIIEQNRLKLGSNQSLFQRSFENVYKPPSTASQEKEEEDCEIYESITENPDDSTYYIEPISTPTLQLPPLPVNTALTKSTSANSLTASTLNTPNKNERSPDKKSATLPHPGSSSSLSTEMRATRPLPPPPFGQTYMNFSWFHNVTREQATVLIRERAYSIAHNGHFLVRPSTSDVNSPLVLVVWLKDRVYNVPIRKRADGRFALGSVKTNEKTFVNVDEIITYYSREELDLSTGGKQMGRTKLTDSPPK